MEIPAINLKAIVLVHWLLTVWGNMAWLPPSFAWGNFSVFAIGVWAIAQRDSIDAVLMFLVGMTVTILTDIIHFGVYYPLSDMGIGGGRSLFRFSAGMAILSLLLKPVSCFFVYQMYRERGGDSTSTSVFPLSHETETPTSPSTSRTNPPARPTPSTRPRTANPPAHTEAAAAGHAAFSSDSMQQFGA